MNNPEVKTGIQPQPAFLDRALERLQNTRLSTYVAIGTVSLAGAIGINTVKGAVNPDLAPAAVECSSQEVTSPDGKSTSYEKICSSDGASPDSTAPPEETETPTEPKPPKQESNKKKTARGDSIKQPKNPTSERDKWPIGFVNYDQGDWAYPSTNCGPTSYAMVAATLKGTKRITPNTITGQISPRWYNPGVTGTEAKAFFAMGNRHGLKVEDYKGASRFQQAKETLREGGLAIIHAKPGSGYFTEKGHYLVIKRVQSGKFRIADSNGRGRQGDSETRRWSVKALKKRGIGDIWTFKRKK